MEIAAFCNWKLKFLGPILDYWRDEGHVVRYEMGYSANSHERSDVCFIDACDNNAIVGSRNRFPNSKLVIRAIDIECWVRQPGGVTWENVDALIFGAKHIQEETLSYAKLTPNVSVHHIPFGVDVSKWTFRERDGKGRNIAFVAHQWSAKGLPLLLQAMMQLPGWNLHVLGTKSNERWLHRYVEHIITSQELNVTFTVSAKSVDEWLEDKDYLIVTSQKEAFSYVAAEAAAKGIRPLIHDFWGARDIWPDEWVWTSIPELLTMVRSGCYDSYEYRKFVEDNYSLELMMYRLNQVIEEVQYGCVD